jgi:hypothetical protein
MSDFDDFPPIDDPGRRGGGAPEEHPLPPGDTADDTGEPGEPEIAELDLPGPNDQVAWGYIEPGTDVVGPNGEKLGKVQAMLGTDEGIFHGVAVDPQGFGPHRVVCASQVTLLTPSRVQIALDEEGLRAAEEYQEREG